jgi:hypothetical protein
MELTQEQKQRIARIDEAYEAEIASLQQDEDGRMERYYNCEDDYSWGGLCSKANDIAMDRAKAARDRAIEVTINGGWYIEHKAFNILKDIKSGETLNARIVSGRFGRCWMIGDGTFVSIPRKQDTLIKKGYCMYAVKQTIKVDATTKARLVLSEDITCTTEIVSL